MKKIIYGNLMDLGNEISKIQPKGSIGIVTDQNVAEYYMEECAESLRNQGFELSYYIIPPGEESKTGEVYLEILNSLARDGITRTDGIVALGGGVVGDLAGFVAATYMRGIKVYQVPTTLLSMVDSSIGGKTGIDLETGKNLAGAFHMPSLIFQDQNTLSTLPEEELLNGMAEVIKYGILSGGEFYELLTPEEEGDIDLDRLIKMSGEYKTMIVERDERDLGERQLLNLGHTFGHAIEKLSNYEIKHGFAVAMGLAIISELSFSQGWCNKATRDEIIGILDMWGYDLEVPYSMEDMLDVIKVDKKRKGNQIDLIIPKEIGRCEIKRLDLEELESLF